MARRKSPPLTTRARKPATQGAAAALPLKPALECAEVAIFLRATFASWYNLPFYMSAGSGSSRVHYGHFGIVDADGRRLSGYPKFRDSYRDYTDMAARMSSEELIASIVGCIGAPASNIAGAIGAPASNIASILSTIEEKAA